MHSVYSAYELRGEALDEPCDKSMNEPIAPVINDEIQDDEASSKVETRALSDWTGKDIKEANGSWSQDIFIREEQKRFM